MADEGPLAGPSAEPPDSFAVAEQSVQRLRDRTAVDPTAHPHLAAALSELSRQQRAAGRPADASASAEKAAEIHRMLAAHNPSWLPELAAALVHRSDLASGLADRPGDALSATAEAVGIRRILAAADPGYLGDLAVSLEGLDRRHAAVGRPADALPPAEEVVRILRTLVADRPGRVSDLASQRALRPRHPHEALGRPDLADSAWSEVLTLTRVVQTPSMREIMLRGPGGR